MKKVLSVALSIITAVCVLQTGAVQGLFQNTSKSVQAAAGQPSNPAYDEAAGTMKYSYVYFGNYPQSEVTGTELTDAIKNAEYNVDDEAVVDGVKYRRMKKENATYTPPRNITTTQDAFYQWEDSTSYHYFKYEPIKWRVLENNGESLLLLADNALDCKPYSAKYERFTWASSPMRSWLNAYDGSQNALGSNYADLGGFITYAFTDAEKAAISTTTLKTEDNHIYNIPGGVDTNDKIFLLSVQDVTNPAYGFSADYAAADAARRVEPSEYAFAMGTWLGTSNDKFYGSCWWLLRTPGSYEQNISMVYRSGVVYQEGYQVSTSYYGACPALRVDIDSDLWTLADDTQPTATPAPSETSEPPSPTPTATPDVQVTYGDVNGDNDITLEDANIVLKMALSIISDPTKEKAADVDGSGDVTLTDANLVLKRALSIISEFPVETATPAPTPTVSPATAAPTQIPVTPTPTAPPPTATPLVQTSHEPSGRIWIAADSIAAKHDNSSAKKRDTIGWGVIFKNYFTDDVTVYDTALSSRSAKSFTTETSYQYILNGTTADNSIIINGKTQKAAVEGMGAGDYLLISFGHNDEFPDVVRNTDPYGDSSTEGSYKWYLKTYFIDPAIRAGAKPVLISPVVKRNFVDGQLCPQFHEIYATAMQELSKEYEQIGISVPYIDLHHKMQELYQQLGDETTKLLHACYYADGVATMDNVHFTYAGAKYASKYILEGMQELGLDINKFRNEEAISTLDNITPTEEFSESEIGL